ncbi:helix-turn-helix domain-containing protein [Companilactobacillus sp. HBUAS56257]|uniref:helix-turn-helix domain-containing protein n=1 Tax=Companilactobacillus sp. HBUAS56257 TaxID=3109360 RepID=UPI002FF0CB76
MKKIRIGSFLNKERTDLNLTQSAFVKNILSVSQYSRVENGEQDLKSEDLIAILIANKINIEDFFTKVLENKSTPVSEMELKKVISEKLAQAFYDHNLSQAKKIEKQISKLTDNRLLYLKVTIIIAIL